MPLPAPTVAASATWLAPAAGALAPPRYNPYEHATVLRYLERHPDDVASLRHFLASSPANLLGPASDIDPGDHVLTPAEMIPAPLLYAWGRYHLAWLIPPRSPR